MRNINYPQYYRADGYRSLVKMVSSTHTIRESDIVLGGFAYDDRMVEGSAYQVGTAIPAEINVTLDNSSGVYNKTFLGKEFTVSIASIKIDGTESESSLPSNRWSQLGIFIVVDVDESNSVTTTMTLQDRMVLLDQVIPSFTTGWTLRKALIDLCLEAGVTVSLSTEEDDFLRTLFTYESGNEQEITYRDLVRGCALLMCENAYMTETGVLAFKGVTTTSQSFTTANRYSSRLGEVAKIGGVVVTDDEGIVLYDGSISGANNIIITPTSSVILNLIGGVSILANRYADGTYPIPGRGVFGREYYPLEMTTESWWECSPGDVITYVSKENVSYSSIVTSTASVLNGQTSITSTADEEARDVPTETDSARTTTKALADAADDASKVATNYLTFSQQTGLDVGHSGTQAKTRIAGDGVEIFDGNGISMEYIGSQNNQPYARIGYESQGYMETSNGGIDLKYNDNEIAHMGWGETNSDPFWGGSEPGTTEMAPYYTFGDRASMFEDNDNVEHDAYVGQNSFVTGKMGVAIGPWSYVGGYGNVATDQFQTIVGYWNDPDEPGSFVVGAGSAPAIGQRANALVVGGQSHAVMIHGDAYVDGNLTADNIGAIAGAINGSTSIANKSVPVGAWTELGTFTLPAGTWIVKVSTRWASKSNATGYRTISISTSSAEEGLSVWNNAKIAPSTTGYTYLHLITFLRPASSSTTYYVNAYNSDSSAHTCAVRWGAIRIA